MTTSDGIVQWFHEEKDQQSKEMSIQWVKYRDIEMEIIETAYQQKQSEVLLDRYRIDRKKFIQYHRINSVVLYGVKRKTNCSREECLRDSDHSKLNTLLGPLCFIIQSYTNTNQGFMGTVYR